MCVCFRNITKPYINTTKTTTTNICKVLFSRGIQSAKLLVAMWAAIQDFKCRFHGFLLFGVTGLLREKLESTKRLWNYWNNEAIIGKCCQLCNQMIITSDERIFSVWPCHKIRKTTWKFAKRWKICEKHLTRDLFCRPHLFSVAHVYFFVACAFLMQPRPILPWPHPFIYTTVPNLMSDKLNSVWLIFPRRISTEVSWNNSPMAKCGHSLRIHACWKNLLITNNHLT